jgi:hypothetical protein
LDVTRIDNLFITKKQRIFAVENANSGTECGNPQVMFDEVHTAPKDNPTKTSPKRASGYGRGGVIKNKPETNAEPGKSSAFVRNLLINCR